MSGLIDVGIANAIGEGVKGLFNLIDEMHTSEEEKLNAKTIVLQTQSTTLFKALEYERGIFEAQVSIIQAEAKSEHWLTANWRPLIMMWCAAMITLYWFDLTPPKITEEIAMQFMELVKWGLGGYVVGRSAEKVAKSIGVNPADIFSRKKKQGNDE